MKTDLLKEIKKIFPNYKSRAFDYDVNLDDIEKLFAIMNKHLFNSKIDRSFIDFYIRPYGEFEKKTKEHSIL